MDGQLFMELIFAQETFEQKLNILKTTEYDVASDCQPDAILTWFEIDTLEEAFAVANVFKSRWGDSIVCQESSICCKRLMTMMDDLEDTYSHCKDLNVWLFKYAFEKIKMKRAAECDTRYLIRMYGMNEICADSIQELKIDYNYELIKKSNSWLYKEIQQHLFHPSRVENWLKNNDDIELYKM